jgi:hypothetical protein
MVDPWRTLLPSSGCTTIVGTTYCAMPAPAGSAAPSLGLGVVGGHGAGGHTGIEHHAARAARRKAVQAPLSTAA